MPRQEDIEYWTRTMKPRIERRQQLLLAIGNEASEKGASGYNRHLKHAARRLRHRGGLRKSLIHAGARSPRGSVSPLDPYARGNLVPSCRPKAVVGAGAFLFGLCNPAPDLRKPAMVFDDDDVMAGRVSSN